MDLPANASSPSNCAASSQMLVCCHLHVASAAADLPPPPSVDEAMDDGGDQEERIVSYEEALAKIKDATGVSDIQEVVDRFLNQVGMAQSRRVLA